MLNHHGPNILETFQGYTIATEPGNVILIANYSAGGFAHSKQAVIFCLHHFRTDMIKGNHIVTSSTGQITYIVYPASIRPPVLRWLARKSCTLCRTGTCPHRFG